MTKEQIAEINRCLGILEGFVYFVTDNGVADGLINVVERIGTVIREACKDEAD